MFVLGFICGVVATTLAFLVWAMLKDYFKDNIL